jgi:glycosyltransferase involved in cell wall biosynthesis
MSPDSHQEWSAILTSYNSINLIDGAIESALTQTVLPREVIIVDDCSTDGSFEYLCEIARTNPLLQIFRTDRNTGGAAEPRNLAIKEMKTAIGVIFDDDDVSLPQRAEIHLKDLSNGAAVSYVGSLITNPILLSEEKAASDFFVGRESLQELTQQLLLGFRRKNSPQIIVPSSVAAFKKDDLVDLECFDSQVLRREDIDLAIRLLQKDKKIIGNSAILVKRLITSGDDKSRAWDVECERRVFEKHKSILTWRYRFAGRCLHKIRHCQANSRSIRAIPFGVILSLISPSIFTRSLFRWVSR